MRLIICEMPCITAVSLKIWLREITEPDLKSQLKGHIIEWVTYVHISTMELYGIVLFLTFHLLFIAIFISFT